MNYMLFVPCLVYAALVGGYLLATGPFGDHWDGMRTELDSRKLKRDGFVWKYVETPRLQPGGATVAAGHWAMAKDPVRKRYEILRMFDQGNNPADIARRLRVNIDHVHTALTHDMEIHYPQELG